MQSTTESIVIKLEYNNSIKRTRNVPSSLAELQKLILECFPELASVSITISYRDKENDCISLTTEDDLKEAYLQLKEDNKNVLKFFIRNLKDVQGHKDESAPRTSNYPVLSNPFTEEAKGMAEINERMEHATITDMPRIAQSTIETLPVHERIICDGCEMTPIRGDRYKCIICPNYDLCSNCNAKGIHAEHSLMKINAPFDPRVNSSQIVEMDINPNSLPKILDTLRTSYAGHQNWQAPTYPWAAFRHPFPQMLGYHPPGEVRPMPGREGAPFWGPGFHGHWGRHHRGAWGRRWGRGGHEAPEGHKKKHRKMGIVVGGKEKRFLKITCGPGMICEANWQLKNEGHRVWPANVSVNKRGGDIDFESVLIQGGFQPGELINLSIPIEAPKKSGTYRLKLALDAEEGYQVGKCLSVELTVSESSTEPRLEMEEVVSHHASEMEKAGYGSFEQCYDALITENGNVEAAKTRCTKPKK